MISALIYLEAQVFLGRIPNFSFASNEADFFCGTRLIKALCNLKSICLIPVRFFHLSSPQRKKAMNLFLSLSVTFETEQKQVTISCVAPNDSIAPWLLSIMLRFVTMR